MARKKPASSSDPVIAAIEKCLNASAKSKTPPTTYDPCITSEFKVLRKLLMSGHTIDDTKVLFDEDMEGGGLLRSFEYEANGVHDGYHESQSRIWKMIHEIIVLGSEFGWHPSVETTPALLNPDHFNGLVARERGHARYLQRNLENSTPPAQSTKPRAPRL